MQLLHYFIVLVICFHQVFGWRKFHLGQRNGGLPVPDGFTTRTISTLYFEQKLDHFNSMDTRTWSQRYYVNDENFNSGDGNCVFLMIGGESQASIRWMNYGAWYESAQEYGALMFQLEHRFYGQSQPFGDISTESLRYLSTHQAIEDLATFIKAMNEQYNLASDVKWILFGGSYPGSIAAWVRQKYPHLVAGAMSASGPLLAVLDFNEYLQVVINDLATHSQNCVDSLQAAFQQLDDLITEENYEEIDSLLNLCDSIVNSFNNTKDLGNLYEVIADEFAGVAQYNKNNGNLETTTDTLCDILTNDTIGSELQRLSVVNSLFLTRNGEDCVDYKYEKMVQEYQNTTSNPSTMMRQWIYQTCTEFGFYQTSSQENPVFGNRFPITFFTDLCIDIFGENFTESIINTGISYSNNRYGAMDIKVSSVVFVHGSFDPWYPLGIYETKDESAPAILINGTAHCANMYPETQYDVQELRAARTEVHRLIGIWLSQDTTASADRFTVFGINLFIVLHVILRMTS